MAHSAAAFRPTGDAHYDALRLRYHWNSPVPPPGYQYGIGRGAKPFVTSAETSGLLFGSTTTAGGGSGSTKPVPSLAADLEFLQEADQIEAAIRNHSRRQKKRDRQDDQTQPQDAVGKDGRPPTKLCEADLLTIDNGLESSLAAKKPAGAVVDTPVDGVAARLFESDVDVRLPMVDFTHRVLAAQSTTADMLSSTELEALLKFGSEDDPKTWITRSRVQAQLGRRKAAMRELETGCAKVGHRGAAIWFERLSLVKDSPAEQRQLAEEAVKAFPSSEELWTTCIDLQPHHLQVEWIQRALLQLPSAEGLWLRLLREVPLVRERKAIVRKCLELNEKEKSKSDMARLWGTLADMEPIEKGREMLRLVRAKRQPPSLALLLESAWLEEKAEYLTHWAQPEMDDWLASTSSGTAATAECGTAVAPLVEGALSLCKVPSFVQLVVAEASARYLGGESGGGATAGGPGGGSNQHCVWQEFIQASLVDRSRPVTAALMALCLVLPMSARVSGPATTGSVDLEALPQSWLSDLARALSPTTFTAALDKADAPLRVADPEAKLVWLLWGCAVFVSLATRRVDELGLFLRITAWCVGSAQSTFVISSSARPDEPVLVVAGGTTTPVKNVDEEELLAPVTPQPPRSQRSWKRFVHNAVEKLLQTLAGQHAAAELAVTVAQALSRRGLPDEALGLVRLLCNQTADENLVITLASLEARSRNDSTGNERAAALLYERCTSSSSATPRLWKKLLVHLRSFHRLTAQDCEEALRHCPNKTGDIWLIYLGLVVSSCRPEDRAKLLPSLIGRALSDSANGEGAGARADSRVWAFVAYHVEAVALVNPAAGRRLLAEAFAEFGPQRAIRNGIVVHEEMTEQHVAQLEPLLSAACDLELKYADDNAALGVLRPWLERMPVKPDALLARSIDMTPRATRGSAAGTIMRLTANPGPLTLLSVAKIYHAVKQFAKAAKLVQSALAASSRCGDVHGMLIAMLQRYPHEYAEHLLLENSRGDITDANNLQHMVERYIQNHLVPHAEACSLHSGPLWISVAKIRDPTNVLLVGYRRSCEDMLREVATLTQL